MKILWKCWQYVSRGGNFHDTSPISWIKSYECYFCLGRGQYLKITPTQKFPHLQYKISKSRSTRQRKAWHPLAGGKVDLDLLSRDPRSLWVPPLIIHNLHVKFESYWAKTAVCIVSTRSYTQSAKVDLDLWPRDPKSIGFPPFIINNLHVKFKSDWAKTAVCIVSTRSYTQSAKVDLDLWPRDPKSIGFPKIKTTIIYSNRNSKVGSFEIAKIKITKIISHTFTFKSWKFPAIRYWERWTGWHSVVLCCRYTYRKIHTHFYDLMFCSHWKF